MLRGHCHSGTALLSLRGNNGPDPPRAAMLCLRDLTNPSTFGRDRLPMPHHQAAPPALYHRTVDTGRVFPGRFKRYLLWLYYQFLHLFFSGDGAYFLLFLTEVGSNHREHTVQHIPHPSSALAKTHEEKVPEATLLHSKCSFKSFHRRKMSLHTFWNINGNPQRSDKAGTVAPVPDFRRHRS